MNQLDEVAGYWLLVTGCSLILTRNKQPGTSNKNYQASIKYKNN
jgi:hypothetical protein